MFRADEIVITGMGVITPLGRSPEAIWNAVLQKSTSARHWDDLEEQGFRTAIACRIPDFGTHPLERGAEMAVYAARQAVEQAKVPLPSARTGIFAGSTVGETLVFEKFAEGASLNPEKATALSFAGAIQQALKVEGPCRAYGTACAAGNYAIGAAARSLRRKTIDVAIAGGVDPFSRIAMAGFSRSRAMASDGICRPFDKRRNGMLLGEGAAFLVLERAEDAQARHASPLAVAGAAGLRCDAYHPTAPDPEGSQMEQAMRVALEKQGAGLNEIAWVCAHGSGTALSDATEAKAIARIFGDHRIPVSGFKGAFGHALGAATAIEAVLCILSLQHRCIPPTPNYEESDPELPVRIPAEPLALERQWVLNCGYAFGGLNAALLFGQWT